MKLLQNKLIRWSLPCAIVLSVACAGMTQERDEKDKDEVVKSIADVPAAVRAAATKTCGSEFKKISKEKEDGELRYEFEYLKNGAETAAIFTERGVLCEIETAVPAAELPATLIAEIQARYPGATIQRAEATEVHGFEVLLKVGGKSGSVEASASGHLARDEEGDEESEEDEEHEEHK